MNRRLEFTVGGPAVGAQRHRTALVGGRASTYFQAAHRRAQARIETEARRHWRGEPLDEPVLVQLRVYRRRPSELRRHRHRGVDHALAVGKPDVDNVAKLVLDALTRARVWVDDSRVAVLVVERYYLALDADGRDAGDERTEVLVSVLE